MKIYYSTSVRTTTTSPVVTPAAQIQLLKNYGQVLTEHLASPTHVDMGMTDAEIHAQDMQWLAEADLVVAECSNASLGVGYIIGQAVALNKKIICLYQLQTKLSAMIQGSPNCHKHVYSSIQEYTRGLQMSLLKMFPSPKVFLCGPPGAGKSTVARVLQQKLNLVNLSTGQILRDLVKTNTSPLATEVQQYMSQGVAVPAAIMKDIVLQAVTQSNCLLHGFVLDGYPPTQADLQNLHEMGLIPDVVFYFECSDDVATARQCSRGQRDTDNATMAATRLQNFHEHIPKYADMATWYPQTTIVKVWAEHSIEEVTEFVKTTVERLILPTYGQNFAPGTLNQSYFPIPPTSRVNGTQHHFHIDAPSHRDLLKVLQYVFAVCPELHGHIKVYPIRNLELGNQVYNHDAYSEMVNFHRISEMDGEAFCTGRLGGRFDPYLMARVLAAVQTYQRQYAPTKKFMVEYEEYSTEYTLRDTDMVDRIIYVNNDTHNSIMMIDLQKFPMISKVPPMELHLAFNLPKDHANLPIDLKTLNELCTSVGFKNGGWFIFEKPDMWAYRSNEFAGPILADNLRRLQTQAHMLSGIITQQYGLPVDIGCSLEYVHGIWTFA